MKLRFPKTTKGRIICALCISFALLLIGITMAVMSVKDTVQQSMDDGALSGDIIMAATDDKKAPHLMNGEWQCLNAEQYAMKRQYSLAHKAYTNAVDEFTKALGPQARMTSVMIGLQARFEYGFRKYQLAEQLFREELEIMHKQKMSNKSIYLTQKWLAETFLSEHKLAEGVKMAVDSVGTAKQIDEESHSNSHTMFFEALQSADLTVSPNTDAEKLYDEGLVLARQMPNRKKLLAELLDDAAECRSNRRDLAGAMKLQSEAISIEPTATRYWERGLAYSEIHDSNAAIRDYSAGLRLEPKSTGLLETRAEVYRKVGDYAAALADYNTAIEEVRSFSKTLRRMDNSSSTLMDRGDLYMDMQKYQLAVDDFSEAMRWLEEANNPETSRTRILENKNTLRKLCQKRAKAYRALGKVELAKADEEKAAALTGSN